MTGRLFPALAALCATAAAGAAPAAPTGPGSLDTSFGNDGRVTTTVGPSAFANAVAADGPGVVAVGGAAYGGAQEFAVVRYGADGNVTQTDLVRLGTDAVANAVAVGRDGALVVAGEAAGRFGVVRMRADGSLGTVFPSALEGSAAAVAAAPDGAILVAGVTTSGGRDRIGLARYRPDGGLDPHFGSGGVAITTAGASSGASAVALQPDGKIVVAGWSGRRFAAVRYLPTGRLDTGFGRSGIATAAIDESASADDVLLEPDGKIVLGGGSFREGYDRFALARFDSRGRLDPAFGSRGTVATSVGSGNIAAPIALAREPSGKLLAAGSSEADWKVSFAVARYDQRGRLDHSFGDRGGIVTTAFDRERAFARAVALQPGGRAVVAGYEDDAGSYRFALARYVVVGCVVPDVRRSRLVAAGRAIHGADCSVGRVTRVHSRVATGRVVAQSPSVGTRLPQAGAVDLVVSRGRR